MSTAPTPCSRCSCCNTRLSSRYTASVDQTQSRWTDRCCYRQRSSRSGCQDADQVPAPYPDNNSADVPSPERASGRHEDIADLQRFEIAPHQPKRITLFAPRAINFSKVRAAIGAPIAGPAAKYGGSPATTSPELKRKRHSPATLRQSSKTFRRLRRIDQEEAIFRKWSARFYFDADE